MNRCITLNFEFKKWNKLKNVFYELPKLKNEAFRIAQKLGIPAIENAIFLRDSSDLKSSRAYYLNTKTTRSMVKVPSLDK